MFSDPQTITVNAVATPLPRVETSGKKTIYQSNDQSYTLTISHVNQGTSRVRSMVRVDRKAIVPDPLTSVNDYETLSVYLVIDRPLAGFTSLQVEQLVDGFKAFLNQAAVQKVYGQES